MVRFRDISIRRKLLLINVLTTSTALVMASTAFITYERTRFQEDVARQLSTVADVVGANSRALMLAGDRAGVNEVLRGLAAEARITGQRPASRPVDAGGQNARLGGQPAQDFVHPCTVPC